MALPLWTLAQLENHCGRDAVLAILDNDNDGVVDEGPLEQLQTDCDTYVLDMIRGTRAAGVMEALVASPTASLRRLSLQWAMAQVWKRAASHARGDWLELEKAARSELVDIRKSDMRIDIDAGETVPGNVGGVVIDSSGVIITDVLCCDQFTYGYMGDF